MLACGAFALVLTSSISNSRRLYVPAGTVTPSGDVAVPLSGRSSSIGPRSRREHPPLSLLRPRVPLGLIESGHAATPLRRSFTFSRTSWTFVITIVSAAVPTITALPAALTAAAPVAANDTDNDVAPPAGATGLSELELQAASRPSMESGSTLPPRVRAKRACIGNSGWKIGRVVGSRPMTVHVARHRAAVRTTRPTRLTPTG